MNEKVNMYNIRIWESKILRDTRNVCRKSKTRLQFRLLYQLILWSVFFMLMNKLSQKWGISIYLIHISFQCCQNCHRILVFNRMEHHHIITEQNKKYLIQKCQIIRSVQEVLSTCQLAPLTLALLTSFSSIYEERGL